MTTVVKVTKANRAELLVNPLFVWVGRPCGRLGMKGSKFANPWSVGMEWKGTILTKGQAAAKFARAMAPGSPDVRWAFMRAHIAELRGRILGCACGDWQPGQPEIDCHAVHLAKLADATGGEP